MPYISQECMRDFIDGLYGGDPWVKIPKDRLVSAMRFFFGYKELKK